MESSSDLWVFGYGSLMWRPDFDFAEAQPALIWGWHRALCVYSYRYRGTPEEPGLVLGLDRGGSCRGTAFRVLAERVPSTLAYLRERELVSYVYRELIKPVQLLSGERVPALVYVADRNHKQYAGRLSLDERLALVRRGRGTSGPNCDYVTNTLAHLEELGVHDPELSWIAHRL